MFEVFYYVVSSFMFFIIKILKLLFQTVNSERRQLRKPAKKIIFTDSPPKQPVKVSFFPIKRKLFIHSNF